MGELVGKIKIVVAQGKKLVVRDFISSDPYVVLKFGSQTAKTRYISSNLNPVWNEEFTFPVTEPVGSLNLEVFDKDLMKSDKMGRAFLDIKPIASSARVAQAVNATDGETIRMVTPANDNCLLGDSPVKCVNGEIVQEVWLKLSGVESGEIELKLKWVYLPSRVVGSPSDPRLAAASSSSKSK